MTDQDAAPTFEELLSDPHGQFDPDGELLPHLIAFGPPKPSRPWLFDAAVTTTAVPFDAAPRRDIQCPGRVVAYADGRTGRCMKGPAGHSGECA